MLGKCQLLCQQRPICGKLCFSVFILKKKPAEIHRLLCEAYGDYAPSISTCEFWFCRFKSGNFDTDDKERSGQPKKFEDEETLLDKDSCQTLQKLSDSLEVDSSTVGKRIKALRQKKCSEIFE